MLAVGVVYLTVYGVLGGGTRGSGGYHDPLANPLGFAELAIVRVPILLGDAALAIPAELAFVASHAVLALAGLVATGVVVLAYRATRPHPPGLGWLRSPAWPRCCPAWQATRPAACCSSRTSRSRRSSDRSWLEAWLCRARARGSPCCSPSRTSCGRRCASCTINTRSVAAAGSPSGSRARCAASSRPAAARFLIAASDPFVFLYPHAVLAGTARGAVTCWSVLSAARGRHRLTRTGEHELMLEPLDHPLLAGSFDVLFRAPDRAFIAGDTVDQCGATIRVIDVQHGLPSRLAISYQRRLDNPKLTFLVWRDHHLARIALPAIGESVELPGQ